MFLAIVNLEEFNHTWQFWKQYIGEEQADSDMEFVQNLHRRILRLKILHRQFHLSTVLVGKNTKNE